MKKLIFLVIIIQWFLGVCNMHAGVTPQTITFNPLPVKTYGDIDFDPGATASSGLSITYNSSNTAVATIVSGKIHIVKAGSCNITASQAGDATYNFAPSVIQPLTISKAPIVATAVDISKTYGAANPVFTITYTGFVNSETSTAISTKPAAATTATVTSPVGAYPITLSGGVATNYTLTLVSGTLTITQTLLTATATSYSRAYGVANALIITYSGWKNSETVAVIDVLPIASTIATVATIPGSYPITLTGGTDNNYSITLVDGILTISKLTQTITFGNLTNKTVLDGSFPLTATASSGLPVSYVSSDPTIASVSGNIVTILNVGTTTITASQPGDFIYSAAAPVAKSLTITKKSQTITFGNLPNKTVLDGSFALTAVSSSGLPVSYVSSAPTIASVSGNIVTILNVGTTSITASQAGDGNYSVATPVVKSLTITKKSQTITFGNLATKTVLDGSFTLTATSSSGLPVSYVSSDPTIASVSGNIVTILSVGTTTITASQSGDASYSAATSVPKLLTITKKTQTITFAALTTKTASDGSFALTGTASSGLPLSYVSSDPSVASVSGNIVTILTVGSTIITASQPGNINYTAANNVARTLTINVASQTITFPPLPLKNYGEIDFDPGATASSGLLVTYFSSNPLVATIVNNKILITGMGTTDITAIQNGSMNYSPATFVVHALTVNRAVQTISFPDLPVKTFNDPDFNPGATTSSGLPVSYSSDNLSVAIIVRGNIRIISAGTAKITAYYIGDPNYVDVSVFKTLTVNKAPQTITFSSLPVLTFGCEDFYPGALSSSDLDVSYQSDNLLVATIVNGRIHVIGTGSARITASQSGNSNYLPAPDVVQLLNVSLADQTITFDAFPAKSYISADFNLTAIASSALPISYSSSNPAVATVTNGLIDIVSSGNTIIKASQSGNANYNAALDVSQTLVIDKAAQTISFNSFPAKIFGDVDFAPVASSSSGMALIFTSDNTSVATIVNSTIHITGTGTVHITASQSGNTNYLAASQVTQQLIVKNENQTITFTALTGKTYGDADFNVSAISSSGLPVSFMSDNTNVVTVLNGLVHITGAGSVNLIAMQAGDAYYNAASYVYQSLVVAKASQQLFFAAIPPKLYTDVDFSPGASSDKGLPIMYTSSADTVALFVGNEIHIMGAGIAQITASQPGNNNYNAATPPITQLLVVNPAPQVITFGAIPAKVYGNPDFVPLATSNSGLEINFTSSDNNVASIVNGYIHIKSPGTTVITANQPSTKNYSAAFSKSQTLKVIKALQSITFKTLPPVKCGDDNLQPEATSTSGMEIIFTSNNSDVATIVNGWIRIVNAGTAIITASQAGNTNYSTANSVNQTLTVTKRSQEIYFDTIPAGKYGDNDFDPGAVTSSGLQVTYISGNPAIAKIISNNIIHIVAAGSVTITARQSGNPAYDKATDVSKIFIVKKADVIVTADDLSRKYKTLDPIFTCSYSGFVNGDTKTGIDILPSVVSNSTFESDPGKYSLTPQNGSDNNYLFTYKPGSLLILGTTPIKPTKPFGSTLLCINPESQTYSTSGGIFSTTYEWAVTPAFAGIVTGTSKTVTVNFEDAFTGRIGITVKGKNNQGISESSDTLFIIIAPKMTIPDIVVRGRYCNNNIFGDSIILVNTQIYYSYQLSKEGNIFGNSLQGNNSRIGWYDLKAGSYTIVETLCNVALDSSIIIKEIDPSSAKPLVQVKWNDVLVCVKTKDSIGSYQWFKDGASMEGENKQFLWTQQKKGIYSVKTTDDSGCEFFSESILIEPSTNGLLYPNPNNGQFKVSFTNSQVGQVVLRIANMNSFTVKSFSYQKDNDIFEQEITVDNLPAGIYYIDIILNGNRVFYEKLIIE